MADLIKPTFYTVTQRPLHSLPPEQPRHTVDDMPRGSVRDRIRFYEQLKERSSVSPTRVTVDSALGRSRLNERVELDNPVVATVRQQVVEELRDQEKRNSTTEDRLAARVFSEEDQAAVLPVEAAQKTETWRSPPSTERLYLAEPLQTTEAWRRPPATEPPHTAETWKLPSILPAPQLQQVVPKDFFPGRDPALDESMCKPHDTEWAASPLYASVTEAATQEAEIDAICMNCHEYISLNRIDEHSLMCVQPAAEMTYEEEIALRLRKLHRAISRRAKEASGDKLFVLLRLRELAAEAVQHGSSRAELELEDLALSSLSLEGGVGCSVLARRLSTLLGDLQSALPEVSALTPEHLLNHYNAEVERQRRELRKWKAHTQVLEALAGARTLDEVQSDVGSDAESVGSSQGSAADVGDLQAAEEALQQISEDQLRRYFYSQCLKAKLQLPKTHPGHKILVSKLYEEARDLPVARWRRFIKTQLEPTSCS